MINDEDKILLGKAQAIPELEAYTNIFLHKLASITGTFPAESELIWFDQCIIKVKRLREKESSSPSDITPAILKT